MVIILPVYRWEKGRQLGLSKVSVNLAGGAQDSEALVFRNKVIPREQNWAKATESKWSFIACLTEIISTV